MTHPSKIQPSAVTTPVNGQGSHQQISPITQLALLLVPIVLNCFFIVYSLVGWILEGRDKLNWALEAESVALWVCVGIVAYSAAILIFVRFKSAGRYHLLSVSSWGHIVISVLLTVSVFVSVRL